MKFNRTILVIIVTAIIFVILALFFKLIWMLFAWLESNGIPIYYVPLAGFIAIGLWFSNLIIDYIPFLKNRIKF